MDPYRCPLVEASGRSRVSRVTLSTRDEQVATSASGGSNSMRTRGFSYEVIEEVIAKPEPDDE
jgi:hypothetical protein